jgi:hypothetical protein
MVIRVIMNLKIHGREGLTLLLIGETEESYERNQDIQSQKTYLNLGPPEHEGGLRAGAVITATSTKDT